MVIVLDVISFIGIIALVIYILMVVKGAKRK
jgi:hypothetical protein